MKVTIFNKVKFEDVKQVHMIAKRWFQKSYGNTYHSVTLAALVDHDVAVSLGVDEDELSRSHSQIWVDLCYIPLTYGYDDQFLWSATTGLKSAVSGIPLCDSLDRGPLDRVCKELGVLFIDSVHDVPRQRDL